MISLIYFFSKISQKCTLNFIWVSILLDKHLNVGMELVAPFQKIIKVVIIIWPIFRMEILSERFSHVKDFTVFSFILFERSSINNCQFLEFSNRSKPYILVSNQVVQRIVFKVEVFNVLKVRKLINHNWLTDLTTLD